MYSEKHRHKFSLYYIVPAVSISHYYCCSSLIVHNLHIKLHSQVYTQRKNLQHRVLVLSVALDFNWQCDNKSHLNGRWSWQVYTCELTTRKAHHSSPPNLAYH